MDTQEAPEFMHADALETHESVEMEATSEKVYGPPKIPNTPSKTVNDMLHQRFSQGYTTPIKAGIATYICGIFQAITTLYNLINPDKQRHSHTFWMVACGVVAALCLLKTFLIYHILMACSVLIKLVLFWGFIAFGLFAAGICVSGMVFFDKDGAAPGKKSHSFEKQS